ncbi:MBL fold metallo-hydrolase [Chitinimonas taiwanensis]|uniref:MBL fold metallo-hydrolase n=1 Tax=Chitinimonas taiwanensis TaxID=240412 RepID=UPI0035AE21CC
MPKLTSRSSCLLASLLSLGGCASQAPANPDYDPSKPHHTLQGFRNNYAHEQKGAADFWRWQWQRWTGPRIEHDLSQIPRVQPDLAYLAANRQHTTVTWIGHATVLLQIGGLNILTDPVFSERASPLSFIGPPRRVPLPATLSQLPRIDVVLISHNHYDHLDQATIAALKQQAGGPPQFIVPLGIDRWLANEGVQHVQKLDWWQQTSLPGMAGPLAIHLVPAQHWSKRSLFGDGNRSLWGGFVLEYAGRRLWFAGDTGYSRDFHDIGRRFAPIDFAMIPVGAYAPRWFMRAQHINPAEAVQIHRDVGARQSMGIHWGTFVLTDEALEQPIHDLHAARQQAGLPDSAFSLFAIGETRRLFADDAAAASPARPHEVSQPAPGLAAAPNGA